MAQKKTQKMCLHVSVIRWHKAQSTIGKRIHTLNVKNVHTCKRRHKENRKKVNF